MNLFVSSLSYLLISWVFRLPFREVLIYFLTYEYVCAFACVLWFLWYYGTYEIYLGEKNMLIFVRTLRLSIHYHYYRHPHHHHAVSIGTSKLTMGQYGSRGGLGRST